MPTWLVLYLIFHVGIGFFSWGWYWYSFTECAKRNGEANPIQGLWRLLVMFVGILATAMGPITFFMALLVPRILIGPSVPRVGLKFF